MKKFVLILITILISIDFALGAIEESLVSDNAYTQPSQNYYQGETSFGEFYGSNSFGTFQASYPQTGIVGSAYAGIAPQIAGAYLPSGAPTPPDPNAERLVLPDFNMLKPGNVQAAYPPQSFYGNYRGIYPPKGIAASPVQGCGNCKGQDCMGCDGQTMSSGFVAQGCQAIYPHLSIYKCNSYYAQIQPGKLCTEAGIRCGEFLPLWSKIGRDGMYWSYEWAQCGSSYCYPEVKNLGYKRMGWYQTIFTSNKPGWHILSYWCNDWSNYIYVYVWPLS